MQTQDSCADIDECLLGVQSLIPPPCPPQARCRNYSGSFDCVCPAGTVWNALSGPAARCLRISPPSSGPCTGNGGCGINALCRVNITPTTTAKKCICVKGYKSLQLDNPDVAAVLAASRLRSFDDTVCVREDILPEEQAFYLLSSHKERVRELRQGSTSLNSASTAMLGPPTYRTATTPGSVAVRPSIATSPGIPTPLTAGLLPFAAPAQPPALPYSAASVAVAGIASAATPIQLQASVTPLGAASGQTPHTYTPALPMASRPCLFGICG